MRSLLLIFCTILVIGGGFAAYSFLTGSHHPRSATHSLPPPILSERPTPNARNLRGLGVGNAVWIKQYDHKTGELASQFKADEYLPQSDGVTVHVIRPQAEFFTNDGSQRLRIEGADGDVVMNLPPADSTGRMSDSAAVQAPDRGKLRDVTLSMFQPADSDQPILVVRMNNATFDNDTFRIATDAYTDPAGHRIEADQVPVVVRGQDYDFDGRGLVVRWNERDRRLQLLEIAHGEELTVKNPGALSNSTFGQSVSRSAPPASQLLAPPLAGEGWGGGIGDLRASSMMLASADDSAWVIPIATKSKSRNTRAERARRRHPQPATQPATRPKIVRSNEPTVYQATFEQNVRIFQGERQVVAGDTMRIHLLQSPDKDATTQPVEDEASDGDSSDETLMDSAPSATTSKPTQLGQHAPVKPATTTGTTTAATRPAVEPIIVKWTGRLRIVPLEGAPQPGLVPGKAIVEITGSPVLLTQNGGEARCGSVVYNTADGAGSLRSSTAVPKVTMTDAAGTKISTPRIDYTQISPAQRLATLTGASRAEFPFIADNGARQKVIANWTKECRLHLAAQSAPSKDNSVNDDANNHDSGSGSSGLTIERAELVGDVNVEHPALKLTSDQLALGFEPSRGSTTAPTATADDDVAQSAESLASDSGAPSDGAGAGGGAGGGAQIQEIIATGNVHCRMLSPGQEDRTIRTQRLRVETARTPAGKTYAKLIQADGDVIAEQDGNSLQSKQLTASLAPSTRPASTQTAPESTMAGGQVRLVSLQATDDVKLTTRDGGSATCDKLTSAPDSAGGQLYTLLGTPHASVTNDQTTIAGRTIQYDPARKLATIPGAGTIHGVEPNDPNQAVDIAWQGSANVDGNTDWIDVTDHVVVMAMQSDGTINHATSDKLRAKLGPKAQSAAAAQAGAATRRTAPATTRGPSSAAKQDESASMNFLAKKDIVFVTLLGHVKIRGELAGENGTLARGVNLLAEVVNYDRTTGRMEVPVPGEMRYQDHRLPTTRPDQSQEGPTVGSGRGVTAFQWSKSLVYDEPAMRATMTGDVHIVHKPDANSGQPFDLRGDVLDAFLERAPAATQPAHAEATTGALDQQTAKLRLKRIEVRDHVRAKSPRLDLDARKLIYDPNAQLLTASGDERNPVTLFDKSTGATSTATEAVWNTRTDEFHITQLGGRMRR